MLWNGIKEFIFLLGIIGMLVGISDAFAATEKAQAAEKPKVVIQTLEAKSDLNKIIVPARVEAKVFTHVVATAEGNLTRIQKDLGAAVNKGDVVGYIENQDPGYTFAPVPLRSPTSGVVSQFFVPLMSRVNRGDRVFSVINPESLKVVAEIPASETSKVRSQKAAVFLLNGSAEKTFEVSLKAMSPLVDPRTGTSTAEFEFNLKKQAPPAVGMVGQLSFQIDNGKVLAIPENAIFYFQGESYVRIINAENKIQRKKIALGPQKDNTFVVTDGLIAGEKVIVRSSKALKDNEEADVDDPAAKK